MAQPPDKIAFGLSGGSAVIRAGYLEAAPVRNWRIAAGVLTAMLTGPPSHRLQAGNLRFCFLMKRRSGLLVPAEWPIESVQIVGSRLTARLTPRSSAA